MMFEMLGLSHVVHWPHQINYHNMPDHTRPLNFAIETFADSGKTGKFLFPAIRYLSWTILLSCKTLLIACTYCISSYHPYQDVDKILEYFASELELQVSIIYSTFVIFTIGCPINLLMVHLARSCVKLGKIHAKKNYSVSYLKYLASSCQNLA